MQVKVEKEANEKKEESSQHENNDSSIEDVSHEKKGTAPERMCEKEHNNVLEGAALEK